MRDGFGYNPVLKNEELQKIARYFDADVARVVLKWGSDMDVILIPRSSNPLHIATNLQIHNIYLSQAEMDYINSLNNTLGMDMESVDPAGSVDAAMESVDAAVGGVDAAGGGGDAAGGGADAAGGGADAAMGSVDADTGGVDAATGGADAAAGGMDAAMGSVDAAGNAGKPFVYRNIIYENVTFDRPTIYVSSDDHWIYAFDAETGKVKWKTETADETGSSCAFSLSEEVVYCGADDSYVRALHARNGTLVWRYKTGSSVTSSSHVIADGTLVIGSHDTFLYALNPNGTLRWRFQTAEAVWSSPVASSAGNLVYISSYAETGKNIHAIDTKTGKAVWQFEGQGGFISSPVLSPDESIVVLCSGYGTVFALDSWTGELVWQAQFESPIESSPVFAKNSKLFLATHDGDLAALDSRKGKILWNKRGKFSLLSL